jgi:curved DNA-binding protein CbpA
VAHSASRKISRHRNAPSYYDVLQVTPTVTASEIEASWKRLVRENHPDRTTEDRRPEANERTAAINEAYQALCDPERRARYDRRSGINSLAGARSSDTRPAVDFEKAVDALVRLRRERRRERQRVAGVAVLGAAAVAYTLRALKPF